MKHRGSGEKAGKYGRNQVLEQIGIKAEFEWEQYSVDCYSDI
ncbi:MAG: hypothetical protein ACLSFZ_13385 [Frisingicoccus sp.]